MSSSRPRRHAPAQLRLLDGGRRHDWQLSERARRVGRNGLAEARAALARTVPPSELSQAS
jgi:hypothetical protein